MERPTCNTCPYWDTIWDDEDEEAMGLCRKNAPQSTYLTAESDDVSTWFPEVRRADWCGEHPDFPAYIASLKKDKDIAHENR